MGYILTAGAVMRMLSVKRADPLVAWIAENRIRPYLFPQTLALTLFSIRVNTTAPAADRRILEERYKRLVQSMDEPRSASATRADFDFKSAEILSDLLSIGDIDLGEIDLCAAAVAMQHNLDLVVTDDINEWIRLAGLIDPVLGRLSLCRFPSTDL